MFASLHPSDESLGGQSANEKLKFIDFERRCHIRAFHFSWWWLCFLYLSVIPLLLLDVALVLKNVELLVFLPLLFFFFKRILHLLQRKSIL